MCCRGWTLVSAPFLHFRGEKPLAERLTRWVRASATFVGGMRCWTNAAAVSKEPHEARARERAARWDQARKLVLVTCLSSAGQSTAIKQNLLYLVLDLSSLRPFEETVIGKTIHFSPHRGAGELLIGLASPLCPLD